MVSIKLGSPLLGPIPNKVIIFFIIIHAFFISNAFFGRGSNVAQQNSNFPKIGLTLPEKKLFKMLVRISAKVLEFKSEICASE